MFIVHIALGGCLKSPPVRYGLTEDTGGHLAYLLGAACAAAELDEVDRVEIVTRRFDAPELGPEYARPRETLGAKAAIVRLATANRAYLDKAALEAEIPAFTSAFLDYLATLPRLPDAIHAHFSDAAEVALAARSRFGCKVIYTPHSLGIDKHRGDRGDMPPDAERPQSRLARARTRIARERRALERADATITSSRDEAERQVALYGAGAGANVWRIEPGVTRPEVTRDALAAAARMIAPFLSEPERPMVLAVARPVRKKNLPLLVEAFGTSRALRKSCNLVILPGLRTGPDCGTPEQNAVIRDLLCGMDRHDLWGRMAMPRRHDAQSLAGIYGLAARSGGVFANPARVEPFGLTLIEAASVGLPVVATAQGGPVNIVNGLRNGLLAAPETAAFRAALERISGDADLRDRAARHGLERIDRYSWTAYARRFVGLVRGLAAPPAPPRRAPRRILVSDIDNTLTGCRAGARAFADWARRSDVPFTVATGRSLPEARRVLSRWNLPAPDALITSVGTEIYLRGPEGRFRLDTVFRDRIAPGWDPDRIGRRIAALGERLDLVPQAKIEQRRFKLSYIGAPETAAALQRDLDARGLAARVVHSHGTLIDVLPARAGKAAAAAHVAVLFGLSVRDIVAAGDSGNDLDMLSASGRAIVVGGAPELDALTPSARLFRADRAHAGGVLQGLVWAGLAPGDAAVPQ